ncbi:Cysteine--tRNA ligase [Geodia barretti]|uniref:Cysteine--tRNA ligase n=1 Tax=Geodia barretti TaxID=519541 RepID=A0AA35VXQ7_GEOBA|nr:Cysteine--tRNA ligase [Geodia barretti]
MRLYNTLVGEDREFAPADGKTVKMYVCGVTPYSSTHVGHALSYVVFDTLRRYLAYQGYQVKHIQNFTDVDDKIILRAQEAGISEEELTAQYIEDFFRTTDALNILRADVYPRATQEIEPILDTIQSLVDKGFAYPAAGDVYFRVNRKDDYGKLSHRTLEGMIAGARIQVDEDKEHPMDFVLWKGAKPGEPFWDSPWGPGRPGWHIECTAMSLRYLDYPLDIHGGGQDLIFPHHENENSPERGPHWHNSLRPPLGPQRFAAVR